MANIVVRTVILYGIVVILMRLCGKRQVGQLELPELVTAFMLGQLASYPLSDSEVPLMYGVVPSVILVCLEVFVSFAAVKLPGLRRFFTGRSMMLVKNGKADLNAMVETRVTMEEVLSAARIAGVGRYEDIAFAFLEPSGSISVLPKKQSASDGIADSPVVLDGKTDKTALQMLGLDEAWLQKQLAAHGLPLEKVLYMGVDDAKQVTVVGKETA